MVNKTDLAPYVGVDLALLEADAVRARAGKPFVLADLRSGKGLADIVRLLADLGGLDVTL
ncbi:MAG: urease accessory protein [Xanthobacteraceae bacterium]|nr:MAG: urease accessory protein [Xanthobacteraceae bacterium]